MPGWAPVKFNQTGRYSYYKRSTYSCYSYGPTFGGGHDLRAGYSPNSYNYYSNLGYTYSPPSGYSYGSSFAQSFLAGSYQFNPDEVETFYDANFTSQGRPLKGLALLYWIFFFREVKVRNQLRPFQNVGGINQNNFSYVDLVLNICFHDIITKVVKNTLVQNNVSVSSICHARHCPLLLIAIREKNE